jgi:hypothetical protein
MGPIIMEMANAIREGDLPAFFELMDAVFAQIPADIFLAQQEAYYQTVIYLITGLLGFHVECETRQRRGRPDLIIKLPDRVYIMEFKLDLSPEKAIRQIREKGYADPFRSAGREVILVGVNFASAQKAVAQWLAEPV